MNERDERVKRKKYFYELFSDAEISSLYSSICKKTAFKMIYTLSSQYILKINT